MSCHEFDRFVADSAAVLQRTAYLVVGDMHEAEDLVQETLFRVARRWPRVRRMDHPAAYARRILVNLALRGRPKQSRRRAELSEACPVDPADPAPFDTDDELHMALMALPPRASNAFAGWTARPTKATRAQLVATDAYCDSNIPDPGLPLQLTDTRGPLRRAAMSL